MLSIPGFSDPFSSLSHFAAAGGALVGGFFLLKKARGSALRMASLYVYIFGMVFLFSMSGVYHLLDRGFTPRIVLQRLDHAAIWFMIAGTVTPIQIILFRGFTRWGILVFIWTLAITGLVLKTVFFKDIPIWTSLTFYLFLGWMGVWSAWHAGRLYGSKMVWPILWGGVAYSVGAIVEGIGHVVIIPGVIESHEIFHLFVVLGAYIHFRFIYSIANEPVFNHLLFKVKELPDHTFMAIAKGEKILIRASSKEELLKDIRLSVKDRFQGQLRPEHIHLEYVQIINHT